LPLFRREKLHERLAREGRLNAAEADPVDLSPREPGLPGYHGVQRPRHWDVVLTAEAPDLPGTETEFVSLPDSTIVMDEELEEPMLEPLIEAIETALDPPYRAEAVRRHESVWAVAARRIEVVELPGAPGQELTLTMQDGSRTLTVDGHPEFGSVPPLERIAGERYDSYAAGAQKLDGDLWEVRISPL
jgi:hypothetical protein